MKPNEITNKDVILCKTQKEFDRILKLYNLDPEYMDWDFYQENTVLYPLKNKYGDLNGYCSKKNLNIIKSTEIK